MDSGNTAVVRDLSPATVWKHFAAIAGIPRCSRKEERIRRYVIDCARGSGLAHQVDAAGNVVVRRSAAPGRESAPTIVLQGHLDMVCEKNNRVEHDFERDGITLVRDGDWIRAQDTTLGADNGIAVAMMLALLEDSEPSGNLECLFTVDEESGLTGAAGLDPTLIDGRVLINLDSEEEGVFYIGCAGGCNTYISMPVVRTTIPDTHPAGVPRVRLSITGLRGGHSGIEIHEHRGNSIVLGARLLRILLATHPTVFVSDLSGGGKHNAIPREFTCDLVCADPAVTDERALKRTADKVEAMFRSELDSHEPDLQISLEEAHLPECNGKPRVLTPTMVDTLVDMLFTIPQGVLAMDAEESTLVETSNNLASLAIEENTVRILTSQRSSRESSLEWASERVAAAGRLGGGSVRCGERYPAWTPSRDSTLLRTAIDAYTRLFAVTPEVTVVHAGLECGVIRDRVGPMDMISFGPDLEGAHTPEERLSVTSTDRIWRLLKEILHAVWAGGEEERW